MSANKSEAIKYNPTDISVDREKAHEIRFKKNEFTLESKGFAVDPQVATHLGLAEAKSKEDRRLFDAEVLKYVQKIKDDAYAEAFRLGKEEGIKVAKEEVLEQERSKIVEALKSLFILTENINNFRQKMYEANETEIIRFCYYIAQKIVGNEITNNKDVVLNFIKKIIPEEETCLIRIHPKDNEFIKTHIQLIEKDIDLSAVRFEPDDSLKEGDVLVETENGILDGTLATRLEKVKKAIEQTDS